MKFLFKPVSSFEDITRDLEQIEDALPGRIQTSRTTTGAVGAGVRALITCPWPVTFSSSAYTVTASMTHTAAGAVAGLRVERVESKTVGGVVVCVINDAAAPKSGVVECVAIGN